MSVEIKHSVNVYGHRTGLGISWIGLPCDSVGDAAGGAYAQITLTANGTFGEGASVTLEGSWDGNEWISLDVGTLTEPGVFRTLGTASQPKWMRPRVTGGDRRTIIAVGGVFHAEDATALR